MLISIWTAGRLSTWRAAGEWSVIMREYSAGAGHRLRMIPVWLHSVSQLSDLARASSLDAI